MADFEITMPVSISPKIEIEMPVTVNLITLPYDTNLRLSEIPGTTKTVVSDPDTGKPIYVTFASGNDTIRTDIFLYTESVTWEIRILSNGRSLSIRTKKGEQGQKVYYEIPESAGAGITIPEALRDNLTMSMFQTLVRAMPGAKPLPIGIEIKMPWTPSEGAATYDNYMVLVDYGYYVKEEDAATGTQTWMGVFRQKGAYSTVMSYDAPEQELATEETAIDGLYYYGKSGPTSFSLIELSAGDPIPYDDYEAIYKNEIEDSDCDIISVGYDRYSHSNVRQWMNSDGAAGEWFTPQHVGDCLSPNFSQRRGFMAGLNSEDIAAVQKVRIKTERRGGTYEYTYDKFWLPSVKEMYGVENESMDTTGISDWSEYWHDFVGLPEPASYYENGSGGENNMKRQILSLSGLPVERLMLRSEVWNSNVCIYGLGGRTNTSKYGQTTVINYRVGQIFARAGFSSPSNNMCALVCCCVG